MSTAAAVAATTEDRWPAEAPETPLEQLLLASHLLAADRAVANFGGGNTSAKGTSNDQLGRSVETMWIKASGSDLATMKESDFAPLRLDDIRPLFDRESMSDEDMVAYLAACLLNPQAPRPSIETLLHAFISAAHVHHTHPDAINMLAGARHGESLAEECFGDRAGWIPYIRPGFTLAKQVAELVTTRPELELIILAKHGLVVWADCAEDGYRRTVAVINEAADFVNERAAGPRFGGSRSGRIDTPVDLASILPVIRGAVSSENSKLLVVDTSRTTVEFVSSAAAEELVTIGAGCPDHLVNTKRLPLWVPYNPAADTLEELAERIRGMAFDYRDDYRRYVAEHADKTTVPADPDARVVLIQNVGLVGVGTSLKAATLARDLYQRAIEVMAGALALGGFVSLSAAESFAVEYWPLELYKLSQAPPPRELEGRVAFVTGAAGGIGRAVIDVLARHGAAVVAVDLDADGAGDAVAEYAGAGLAVTGDVTDEGDIASAFAAAAKRFGGVDIVVSNAGIASSAPIEETSLEEWNRNQAVLGTGYFLVARAAFRLLRSQDSGGSLVFIASKNGIVAGKNAAAYSAAKAAELHLARCLAEEGGSAGIRVNSVNPDAVLQGSKIWGSSWREQRAAAYGIKPDELEEHYRRRTTLGVNILPEDIAQAVLHFASEQRSGKSTGNILNVDGGVPAAYTR